MKRITKNIISVLFAFIFLSLNICAADAYNWYCKREKDHKRPCCEASMSFIEKYGGAYLGKNPEEKVIYLTFDAGYENGNIEKILDVLKKHGATGAFFVLENIVKRNTSLIKRMADEGHLVCNHTAKHKDMTKLGAEAFAAEIQSLEATLREVAGVECAKFYRPPQGRFNEKNLEAASALGYKTVFWSFAYADWDNEKQPAKEKAVDLILSNTHNGAVVLLHPTSATNAAILDTLLCEWENAGYRFGTLDELFA